MDKRIIGDIVEYKKGLELITKMNPVSYQMKNNKKQSLGLISQDVQELEPILTNENHGGLIGIDYEKLLMVAINALKELNEKCERLESKIESKKKK